MTPSKGRVQRRERSLPDKAVPVKEPERWYPPDPQQTTTYPIKILLGELGRIIGRTEYDEAHRMTFFALTAQVLLADFWWDVVRIDTCHGEVHAHYMYRTRDYEERETILVINCQNEVDRGYQQAEKMLITCWPEHEKRWRGGC